MHEVKRLETAIAKLSTCKAYARTPIEREILIRGTRVRSWIPESYSLLDKQLTWLDTHDDSLPTYERRFTEWADLLAEYGRACDLLALAESLNIGVAA
jgi:hypothetical protein